MKLQGVWDDDAGMPAAIDDALQRAAISVGQEKYADAQRALPLMQYLAPTITRKRLGWKSRRMN